MRTATPSSMSCRGRRLGGPATTPMRSITWPSACKTETLHASACSKAAGATARPSSRRRASCRSSFPSPEACSSSWCSTRIPFHPADSGPSIMDFNENTVSAVIGGTSGIGRAVAEALAAGPSRVVVAGRTTGLDVADEASVTAFFEKLGAIDHLVYTAGSAAPGGKVGDVSIAAAKTAFDVKFWGSIIVAREAAKRMKAGGSITLTSGFLARRTVPGTFVKTAMNAGIEAVAKLLARELAPLRVNVVSPGLTATEAYAAMAGSPR